MEQGDEEDTWLFSEDCCVQDFGVMTESSEESSTG